MLAAEREMWEAVCRTPVRFVVAGPRSFFTPRRMRRHPLLRRYFQPVRFFNEPHLSKSGRYGIALYRRKSDQPQADGTWCGF